MTYDLIYQVYQDERQKALLSKVEKDFYERVAELISELKEEYDRASKQAPSSAKAMLLLDELKKIRILVREIFEYRIRKVALLALTAASEGTVSTKDLLGREVQVYEQISNVLKGGYEDILKVEQGIFMIGAAERKEEKVPSSKDGDADEKVMEPRDTTLVEDSGIDEVPDTPIATEVSVAEVTEKRTTPPSDAVPAGRTKDKKTVAVLILEDIPRYMGLGGEVYHLKKKDFTRLPLVMAKRLVSEGKARIMPS